MNPPQSNQFVNNMEQLRFPIGKFVMPETVSPEQRAAWIQDIIALPQQLRDLVKNASDAKLDTPYRMAGWTARQVVHHLADSHLNAFARCKLALTENKPTIKPYMEERWAELPDSKGDISPSLLILEGLHQRWASLWSNLREEDWQKTFFHPETTMQVPLERQLALYSWHSRHHLAHIALVINAGVA